jgi:hypothetical protein
MPSLISCSSRSVVLGALSGVALLLAAGCGGRTGLGPDDGGSPDSRGATGVAGRTGGAGTTGTAGVTGTAGATGVAGTTGTAGTIGTAGTTGTAGVTGAAGTSATGQAGAGGSCGALCDIFCQWGNATDAAGCPLCKCNPPPSCQPADCGPAPSIPVHPPCAGGGVFSVTCTRNDVDACTWTGACQACPATACPPTMCPYGTRTDANGCATCACNPPPVCPAIGCAHACPNGARTDANGCPTCDCIDPTSCATNTSYKSCLGDTRCEWLQPGCGQPALATGGCFARTEVGCMGDASCSGGRQCLTRVVDPCYNPLGGATCATCGVTQMICL